MTKEPKAETRTAVEIVVLWGDRSSVLAAVHLDPPRDFVLAEDGGEGADFVVAEGTLHGTPHRLVRTEGGRPEVAAPGEQPRAITGDVSLVRVGDLVFRVRSVVPEQRLPAAPLDREPLRYVAATGAVAALFGALVALEPGASGTLSGDQLDLDSRLVQTLLARPEALPDAAPVAAGATLERTAGRSGAAGDESAPERVRRGQRSGRELGGRESTPASTSSVRTAGVLGVLQSMAGSFGGWARPTPETPPSAAIRRRSSERSSAVRSGRRTARSVSTSTGRGAASATTRTERSTPAGSGRVETETAIRTDA